MNAKKTKPQSKIKTADRVTSRSAGSTKEARNKLVRLHTAITSAFLRNNCQTSLTRSAEKKSFKRSINGMDATLEYDVKRLTIE